MQTFHGWTDNKTFVVVTVGRSKRYGIATLGKKDTFDLIKGTQVALLRLFLTPKTLSSKPKGMPFDVNASLHNLYYEIWRAMLVCTTMNDTRQKVYCWGEILDSISDFIKVEIVLRAPGLKTGLGFNDIVNYSPTFQEVERALYFLLQLATPQDIEGLVDSIGCGQMGKSMHLFEKIKKYMPDECTCIVSEIAAPTTEVSMP